MGKNNQISFGKSKKQEENKQSEQNKRKKRSKRGKSEKEEKDEEDEDTQDEEDDDIADLPPAYRRLGVDLSKISTPDTITKTDAAILQKTLTEPFVEEQRQRRKKKKESIGYARECINKDKGKTPKSFLIDNNST